MSIEKLKIKALFNAFRYCSTWNIFYIIYTSNILNKEKIKMADKKEKRITKPQLIEKVENLDDNKTISFTIAELNKCYPKWEQKNRNLNMDFLKLITK